MQQTRDLTYQRAYYKLKGIAQRVVKDAKKQHWCDYCNTLDQSSKIGKVWKAIKKMSGVERKRSIPTLTEGDLVYDKNQSKAELFAKAFASVSSNSNLTTEFLPHERRSNSNTSSQWHYLPNQMEQLPTMTQSTLRLKLTS